MKDINMAGSDCAHHPITDERKRIFLDTLAETGSVVEAARRATPWGNGRHAGQSSFLALRKRDPEFAAAVDEAKAAALGRVESEITRRTFEPARRPVFENGKVVGWTEDRNSSDKLLLRLAARLDPDWSERRQLEVEGRVRHEHEHMFALRPEHILLLPAEDRERFLDMLEVIERRLEGNDDGTARRALPTGSDHAGEGQSRPAE